MIGDENTQPTESVSSLSDIADLMDGGDEMEAALDGSDDSEESELPEVDADESDEEAEADEADAEEPDEYEFTVKVDGKESNIKLSKEELVESIQKSLDYTQKTMAVAEERKAVQAERAKVAEVRTQHENVLKQTEDRLTAFVQFMETKVGAPPPISLAHENAAQYLALKEAHESQKGQLEQARQSIEAIREEQARQRHAWIMEQAEATEAALRDTLPGWNDETLTTLAKYAADMGLDPQTVDVAFVQKGFWEMAHKARAFDELQARKATLKPKAELPKVAKPKATNQTPRGIVAQQEAMKRFQKHRTLDNLADLID